MPSHSLEGQTLGKYRVLAPLGGGGMARVYRAYQPGLDRYVAIKVLRADLVEEPEFLGRFQREAQAVAALRHPNIVQVFDFDSDDQVYYMVMELLEGNTLKAKLNEYRARGERMPIAEAVHILREALAGLAYAHAASLIHRDLKPANLMLTRHGQAVLTDFGIAKLIGGQQHTATGAIMGTMNYMAPEQGLHGQCDARSDIYALGIVFYEMLTGRVPFEADTPLAILMKHVNDPLPLPRTLDPHIPEALERFILKAVSKQPEDRYQTATEMAEALSATATPVPTDTTSVRRLAPSGVFSGSARAALADTDIDQAETDIGLDKKLAGAVKPTTEVSERGLGRAIAIALGTFVVMNLLGMTIGGALGNFGDFIRTVWPVYLLWPAFLLSLVLESLLILPLLIPISLLLNLGLILGYFTVTEHWGQWFLWPGWALVTFTQLFYGWYWANKAKRQRARQLGRLASIISGGLLALLVIATVMKQLWS